MPPPSTKQNSVILISIYNRIQSYLIKKYNLKKNKSFPVYNNKIRELNPVLRNNFVFIKQAAELRNLIVHANENGEGFAEPHTWVVDKLEGIYNDLRKEKAIFPEFQRPVATVNPSSSVGEIISHMVDEKYSQIPVYDGDEFIGILNENNITRWISKYLRDDIFEISTTKVKDILSYSEGYDEVKFIGKKSTVEDVLHLFYQSHKEGKRLDAVLMTEHGKKSEKLLGIITLADMGKIFQMAS